MILLQADRLSWDKDLQIIHADVLLSIGDQVLIDEPLCIDVGLPAFLFSALEDVKPDRWAPAHEWQRMPFFVCGCGDPECRGFSFAVRHVDEHQIELAEVEERQGAPYRIVDVHRVDRHLYRQSAIRLGRQYIQFVEGLDYKPFLPNTVELVKELLGKLERVKD